MCDWGDTVALRVPIPASHSCTGEVRWAVKPVDQCLSQIVQELNSAGLYTCGACCGHGETQGEIFLHDGTRLAVTPAAGGQKTGD